MARFGARTVTRKMTAPARAARPAGRRLITLVALLAFFLQSLALQTHIHQLMQPVAVADTTATHTPVPKAPKGQDPIDQCRLCQELVHAGAFIAPSGTILPVSQDIAVAVFAALPLGQAAWAATFTWRSRAPPRP